MRCTRQGWTENTQGDVHVRDTMKGMKKRKVMLSNFALYHLSARSSSAFSHTRAHKFDQRVPLCTEWDASNHCNIWPWHLNRWFTQWNSFLVIPANPRKSDVTPVEKILLPKWVLHCTNAALQRHFLSVSVNSLLFVAIFVVFHATFRSYNTRKIHSAILCCRVTRKWPWFLHCSIILKSWNREEQTVEPLCEWIPWRHLCWFYGLRARSDSQLLHSRTPKWLIWQ